MKTEAVPKRAASVLCKMLIYNFFEVQPKLANFAASLRKDITSSGFVKGHIIN